MLFFVFGFTELKNSKRAYAHFDQCVQLDPVRLDARLEMARLLVAEMQRAMALAPDDLSLRLSLAQTREAAGQAEHVLLTRLDADERNPENGRSWPNSI